MNSREFKNEIHSGVYYGPPLFSIQTHEKYIKEVVGKKYVYVGNDFRT